ncbi:MAG: divergent polysaccharide deacetylase family protein [Candidatus Omnitrophica bacterium]|nr:divergent polysaccharide deacetylase family protein [Candidatus Omnitrophota bacterium]
MENKERFYKTVIVILIVLILVMGLVMFLRKPPSVTKIKPLARITRPVKAAGAKIAIVIDDAGNSRANFDIIKGLKKYPVTFSIIPGLNFSEGAARELTSLGFQVILHLPMEPKEKMDIEPNTILTSMDDSQISSIVDHDLAATPEVKGVNNHMGSRVTEDARTLSIVLDLIKSRHLFFLDSFVTVNSLGKQLAEEKKIKFVKRDVFLDNHPDPSYIRQQIEQLKKKARLNGQAVGIGHDRKNTLEVLREELPSMEKEGYKFVFVSDLAR